MDSRSGRGVRSYLLLVEGVAVDGLWGCVTMKDYDAVGCDDGRKSGEGIWIEAGSMMERKGRPESES